MPRNATESRPGVVPQRGELFPTLTGTDRSGTRRSTRDYYMRRNLAVVVVPPGSEAPDWPARLTAVRDRVHAEAGEILLVAPQTLPTGDLPAILDDGALAAKLGLSNRTTPAIFALDRYGLIFATNAAGDSTPDLTPEEIPNWLEFIACRCT